MPATDVTPGISGHAVATGCAVCPHPSATHDQIATRYCTATVAGQFNRGCVCTDVPAPAP